MNLLVLSAFGHNTALVSSSPRADDYVLVVEGPDTGYQLDGIINPDEYGSGNPYATLIVYNVSPVVTPETIGVNIYSFHNTSHIFMGFEYTDTTQTAMQDGVMLIFDEDEDGYLDDWLDLKSVTYGGSGVWHIGDMAQDRSAPNGGPDSDTDIGGTIDLVANGSYSSNTWYWEMIFPMASGDTNGHDIDLVSGDYLAFQFGVSQDNPGIGGATHLTTTQFAIDTPPPLPPELRAREITTAPTLDGQIGQGEYGDFSENITVDPLVRALPTAVVTMYAVWMSTDIYLAFSWEDTTQATGSNQDGIYLMIVDDLKGVFWSDGSYDTIDMILQGQSANPDLQNDVTGTGSYVGGVYVFEMSFPLNSGDVNDTTLVVDNSYSLAVMILEDSSTGPTHAYGFGGIFYLTIDSAPAVPEFPVNLLMLSGLCMITVGIVYIRPHRKK